MQYTEGKEEINVIAVDPVSTDIVPGNTHKRRLLDVRDGSERVKALYCRTFSCINLNGHPTEWFESLVGVRQGDNLSPTLFNIFLNDLANELNALNLGIKMGDLKICMLLW